MQVKVINKSKNTLPTYGTRLSVGVDVMADIANANGIAIGQSLVIPTGLFVEIPEGYEIQVRPRSGLAAKYGITVLNSPGTIDADYRGEIKVILINHGTSAYTVRPGEPIGQLVLSRFEQIEWVEGEILSKTDRSDGGVGSTGTTICDAKPPVLKELLESITEDNTQSNVWETDVMFGKPLKTTPVIVPPVIASKKKTTRKKPIKK